MIFARPLTWKEWILWVLREEPWRIDPRMAPPAGEAAAPPAAESAQTALEFEP